MTYMLDGQAERSERTGVFALRWAFRRATYSDKQKRMRAAGCFNIPRPAAFEERYFMCHRLDRLHDAGCDPQRPQSHPG